MHSFRFFKTRQSKIRWIAFFIVLASFLGLNLSYPKYWNNAADFLNDKQGIARVPHFWEVPFSLGLDLRGGVHLVYSADVSGLSAQDARQAMNALETSIERRANFLGVAEPVVQTERGDDGDRLIVELAGVQDPEEAVRQIGETPFLEFKELRSPEEQLEILSRAFPEEAASGMDAAQAEEVCGSSPPENLTALAEIAGEDPCFAATGLTGQFLDRASVSSDQLTGAVQVALQFDSEGTKLFEEITERNIGKPVAIYLDGIPISMPVVQAAISGGQAVITGNFTLDEARDLSRNLNSGALPVPITLIAQKRVGATLGEQELSQSLRAAVIAALAVLIFLVVVYRFSGLLAVVSLAVYAAILLSIIQLVPVTLTLAGIAGLILSLGLAVDANILIFERLREELENTEGAVALAVDNAFQRAWPSIRDGNISTLLTAAILFWFSTSFVQGFALTLGIGVLVSMFSSMVATRYLILSFLGGRMDKLKFIWTR